MSNSNGRRRRTEFHGWRSDRSFGGEHRSPVASEGLCTTSTTLAASHPLPTECPTDCCLATLDHADEGNPVLFRNVKIRQRLLFLLSGKRIIQNPHAMLCVWATRCSQRSSPWRARKIASPTASASSREGSWAIAASTCNSSQASHFLRTSRFFAIIGSRA
jgi:hypothetical protein